MPFCSTTTVSRPRDEGASTAAPTKPEGVAARDPFEKAAQVFETRLLHRDSPQEPVSLRYDGASQTLTYSQGATVLTCTAQLSKTAWDSCVEYMKWSSFPYSKEFQVRAAVKYGELHDAFFREGASPKIAAGLLQEALKPLIGTSIRSTWGEPTFMLLTNQRTKEETFSSSVAALVGGSVRISELDARGADVPAELYRAAERVRGEAAKRSEVQAQRIDDELVELGSGVIDLIARSGDRHQDPFQSVLLKLDSDERLAMRQVIEQEERRQREAQENAQPVILAIQVPVRLDDPILIQIGIEPCRSGVGLRVFVGDDAKVAGDPGFHPNVPMTSLKQLGQWLQDRSKDPKGNPRWDRAATLSHSSQKLKT